jgi:hypothetical protein
VIEPGLAFAAAMKSWMVVDGKSCLTATTCAKLASWVTGNHVCA